MWPSLRSTQAFSFCSISLLTQLSLEWHRVTPDCNFSYRFSHLGTTVFQTCHVIAGFRIWSDTLPKWLVDKMNKNNTEARSPCAKCNYFQLSCSYCVTIVCTYSTMKIHEDQRHQRSRKDEKDQKMFSRGSKLITRDCSMIIMFAFKRGQPDSAR